VLTVGYKAISITEAMLDITNIVAILIILNIEIYLIDSATWLGKMAANSTNYSN
jgi:hypothetical protein